MDRLEALGNTLSNLTMYDLKSYYEQAKNVVLNVSEIEAKVREATNDDPWGASSTLMQDIANRTFNYPDFNEIMPSIYSRFMEKEARQWRQIYKSLQLLEYLIKHGSERVVDDARAHISTIKMLRNFHYIDDKGKDQGINVRNRAKEIVELLSDVDTIRAERRKAKANKNKYTGTGNDGLSFSSGGSRYGGFGSDSLGYGGGSSSSSYNGGYNNDRSSSYGGSGGFRDSGSRGYEEYNAGDDEVVATSPARTNSMHASSSSSRPTPQRKATAPDPTPAPAPVKEVDLLGGFDDDAFGSTGSSAVQPPPGFATEKALPAVGTVSAKQPNVGLDDDDFADFQAAPTTPATTAAPAAASAAPAAPKMNLMEMLNSTPAPGRPQSMSFGGSTGFVQPQQAQQPSAFNMGMGMGVGAGAGMGMGMGGMGMGQGMGMGMGGVPMGGAGTGSMHRPSPSLSSTGTASPMQAQLGRSQSLFAGATPMQPTATTMRPTMTGASSTGSIGAGTGVSTKPASGSSANFDDLWSMSLGSSTKPAAAAGGAAGGKSIKDLEKEKASAGLWGSGGAKPMGMGSMGGFGAFSGSGSSGAAGTTGGGGDDLLL